jgi:predicted 3-demethylubiquinone-9 3-methyltransferase (glyoxalase superfamily)
MPSRVTPFLMFEGRAEEALVFYCETIPDSRIVTIERYGPEGPGRQGTVIRALASIGGLDVMCIDSPVSHAFTFTPSVSLFVTCRAEEEMERIAATLGQDGKVLMPLDNYGFSRRFAWVNDRFGVSWQVNLE